MDLKQLEKLVAAGESETVEFKKSTGQLRPAGQTLCGFLNASGGHVLIGVSEKGAILGQQVSDSTQIDIAATLKKFEPPASVEIQRVPLTGEGDREVIVLAAATPGSLPFTFDGRPYQRIGTTTSVMPQERYQQLLLQRIHSHQRWENTRADVGIEDLDQEEILRTVRVGKEAGRVPESTGEDLGIILDRFGLRMDGEILNAAVVLFGTHFLPDFPQCQLRLARFKGTDKSEFLDQRQIQGHAFDLLHEAMLFLRRHLPVAGRIQPGLFEREDEPLFPLAALREALVNALCHRNYALVGGAVSVAVYDDRLEIWSDGALPPELSIEDLKRDHQSRPPNPIMADVFFRRGLVERWGRGTQKIVELCVKAGHPEPEFNEQSGAVGVRFLPSGYIAPVRVAHDLTERQREVLQILAAAPRMPFREIRRRMAKAPPDRTLREDLIHLKRLGIVGSEGHGRGAVWFLTRDGDRE
ncbi:MAG: putative DNA binding domain-containing protein [Candidatus Eisenbacteria sp.]|nr:putative DNA binding domain-containing protein [Candidatus Eisenbacteria bacterium]